MSSHLEQPIVAPATQLSRRFDLLVALLLGTGSLLLYLATLAPGLLDGDAGEFQMAAWRLGLAHPTGYPLYLILGHLWQTAAAPLGVAPSHALNAFSALCAAATVALLYPLLLRSGLWAGGTTVQRRTAAALGAAVYAVNPTLWSQAIIAEVYALHGLLLAGILTVAVGLPISTARAALTQSGRTALLWLSFLVGCGLAHHRTTLFILPGLALYVWQLSRQAGWRIRLWWAAGLAVALPQLLYLYIPLRSGPEASPWYSVRLNGETLSLYPQTLAGFSDFVLGRVFAVSFLDPVSALARLPEAGRLWQHHFGWVGLALLLWGVGSLIHQRRWRLLTLTLPWALCSQIFNLFYGIGDIYVFYIPLYLIGTLWLAWGAAAAQAGVQAWLAALGLSDQRARRLTVTLLALFWLLPLHLLLQSYGLVDQSGNQDARRQWQAILAAAPPADAILVTNDRNEMVPLYYLQAVEETRPDLTGLFPLLTAEARFADVAATAETALAAGGGRPVYLIKPMAGLEVRLRLQAAVPPLVEVVGIVGEEPPLVPLTEPFGPMTLLGYDWLSGPDRVTVRLHWLVHSRLAADYTTSVQIFDADDQKLGQDDRPPGGVYYPTSLWKPGQILIDTHPISLPARAAPAGLWVVLYGTAGSEPPAPGRLIPLHRP